MAIRSDWIVASTTARNALPVTMADVVAGHECMVLATGEIYRCVRPLTSASAWAPTGQVYPVSGLSEVGGALADGDKVAFVDVSDTTGGSAGTLKYLLMSRIATYVASANNVTSGTWTPTAASVTNLDATPTAQTGGYIRVGSNVVFFVEVQGVDPTSAAALEFTLTLPVTSNLAATGDVVGVVTGGSLSVGRCVANAGSDLIRCLCNSSSTSSQSAYVFGGMRVL